MTTVFNTINANATAPQVPPVISSEILSLPDTIIKNGQYLVADLDGTIIGAPGKNSEPELNESPCYQPLLNWLSSGGRIVAITGNDLARMEQRFFKHIPAQLRANNKVILIANGGSAFYGTDSQGNLVEDILFRCNSLEGGTVISSKYVDQVIERAQNFVNDFFYELKNNPELFDKLDPKLHFLADIAQEKGDQGFSLEELLTHDTNTLPRIEVRKILNTNLVTQVAVIGVPAQLNFRLDALDLEGLKDQGASLDVKRVSFTTEINLEGVDKALPVYWMMNSTEYDFIPEYSVAFGDRPNENDKPLVELTEKLGMPFVSVCEKNEPISPSAFHIGNNCDGSAKVIEGLLNEAYQFVVNNRLDPVIPNKLTDVILQIKGFEILNIPHLEDLLRDIPKTGILMKQDDENQEGLIYLKVSDKFIERLFPFINQGGDGIDPGSSEVGAHISVIRSLMDQVSFSNLNITEFGKEFSFSIKHVVTLRPDHDLQWEKVWILTLESPELEQLREKYGLSRKLHGNKHDFHITIASKQH